MIWTVLSIVVNVVICARLMFFYVGNEHYQNHVVRWLVLLTTIYSGSRVINHLYTMFDPTRFSEFLFNTLLLVVVLYYDIRANRKVKSK